MLADANDILRPGDVAVGTYPMIFRNADNEPLLLVNTGAEYSYLGRLQVPFLASGVVDTTALNSQINGPMLRIQQVWPGFGVRFRQLLRTATAWEPALRRYAMPFRR